VNPSQTKWLGAALVLGLVGCGLLYSGCTISSQSKQRLKLHRIEDIGGYVKACSHLVKDAGWPEWLACLVEAPEYSVTLSGNKAGDEHVALLPVDVGIVSVVLRGSNITDFSLERLVAQQELRELDIANTRISGQGVSALTKLKTLRWLDVSGIPLSRDETLSLFRLNSLEYLVVSREHVKFLDADVMAGTSALQDVWAVDNESKHQRHVWTRKQGLWKWD